MGNIHQLFASNLLYRRSVCWSSAIKKFFPSTQLHIDLEHLLLLWRTHEKAFCIFYGSNISVMFSKCYVSFCSWTIIFFLSDAIGKSSFQDVTKWRHIVGRNPFPQPVLLRQKDGLFIYNLYDILNLYLRVV